MKGWLTHSRYRRRVYRHHPSQKFAWCAVHPMKYRCECLSFALQHADRAIGAPLKISVLPLALALAMEN
ncbi:hypothetical protein DN38_3273 [Vibrio cholerae]|nr:hypothetical protein DN38_3273 [Vibrio cholerae]